MCFCGVYILHPTAQCAGTPTHRHLSKHCPEVPAHRHSELGKQPQKLPAHSTQAHIVPNHCVPAHHQNTTSSHPKNYKKDTSAHYHNHLRHPMQSTFCYKMFLHLPIKTPYPRKINYMFKLLLSLVHRSLFSRWENPSTPTGGRSERTCHLAWSSLLLKTTHVRGS